MPKEVRSAQDHRGSFEAASDLYGQVRPKYPESLFDDLTSHVQLADDANLLEIGPGTGQATVPLALRGYFITAVEVGPRLAAQASAALAAFPRTRVLVGAFEDVLLPDASFDLVYAATAIHWVPEVERFAKPHRLLRPTGHLAIIHTEHVSDDAGDQFFHATQPIYRRYYPKPDVDFELPHTSNLRATTLDNRLFTLSYFHAYPVVIDYAAREYANLLDTYSSTRALSDSARTSFLNEIRELIESEFGGRVQKHFAMTLTVGRRRP